MAYKNGLQHELNGNTNTASTLAPSSEINGSPARAVNVKNAIGDQHKKSVNTNIDIRFAILKQFFS